MDYSLLTSLTVNIIAFSVGTTITWSSPVLEKLTNNNTDSPFKYNITEEEGSWISASLSLGAVVGPFIFGILMDKIGRKYTLLGIGVFIAVGSLLLASIQCIYSYYIGRFLCGLGGGGMFNLIPVYIGEIANPNKRGMMSSLMNIFFCAGQVFSYCVGPYVKVTLFNTILAVFPLIFLVSFSIIGPESAYYYIKKEKNEMAKDALQKVRGTVAEVEEELNVISKSIKESSGGTLLDIFRRKELRKALFISIGLMLFQQLSGIIAILFYAQTIFIQAGVNLDPKICAIIIGVLQLSIGFITPFTVDTVGRKKLLLLSSVGTFISEGTLGIYSLVKNKNDGIYLPALPLVCLIVYFITYNLGCGPLPWIMMGELFPPNVKSAASLFSTSVSCSLSFLVAKFYNTIVAAFGIGVVFLIFTTFCLISIPFSYFFVIETKGKTLQDIEKVLGK